jgi:hypothetical protein
MLISINSKPSSGDNPLFAIYAKRIKEASLLSTESDTVDEFTGLLVSTLIRTSNPYESGGIE